MTRRSNPIHDRIVAPVTYLPEYLKDDRGPGAAGLDAGRGAGRATGRRGRRSCATCVASRSRTESAGSGRRRVLAAELGPHCRHIHAHFLHTPASVARYAALICRLPWSVSAHAKDVWTTPDWDKREKLAACTFAATCTAEAEAHLDALAPKGVVHLLHHGLAAEHVGPLPVRPDRPGRRRKRARDDPLGRPRGREERL